MARLLALPFEGRNESNCSSDVWGKSPVPSDHSAADRWHRPPMASADMPYAMRLEMFTGN